MLIRRAATEKTSRNAWCGPACPGGVAANDCPWPINVSALRKRAVKVTIEFESGDELGEFLAWRASRPKTPQKTPVESSGLDTRLISVLRFWGEIKFVEDAQAMSDSELLRIPNIGKAFVKAIRAWTPNG
jgi:hypothetical protein